MIVLDTNVVSEMMKLEPDPVARRWLNEQVVETLYLSAVGLAELMVGVAILPEGRRKEILMESLRSRLTSTFLGRILPFEERAARAYADLVSGARSLGRTIAMADARSPRPPESPAWLSRRAMSGHSKRPD